MNYNCFKAILLFNNITIFNNYLSKGRLFNNYFYFIYLYYIIKKNIPHIYGHYI